MTISERVKLLRQEHKWTQAELAERLGIHQKQISAYECGVNLPSNDILIKLAEAFDLTLDYLAFDTKRAAPANLIFRAGSYCGDL